MGHPRQQASLMVTQRNHSEVRWVVSSGAIFGLDLYFVITLWLSLGMKEVFLYQKMSCFGSSVQTQYSKQRVG